MRYLLDTNTCIAAMRNEAAVVARMASLSPGDCAISTITSYELATGIAKCANPAKESAKVNLLLATVSQLAFDSHAAQEAGRIRAVLESQGGMIGPYDVLLTSPFASRKLPGRSFAEQKATLGPGQPVQVADYAGSVDFAVRDATRAIDYLDPRASGL